MAGLLIVSAISMFTSMAIALTVECIAYRRLRKALRLVPLITAIGSSFILQYTLRGRHSLRWGCAAINLPSQRWSC